MDGTKDNTGRSNDGGQSKRKKQRGQNRNRHHLRKTPLKQLCASRASSSELSPAQCPWGDACRSEHDLRKFLSEQPQDPDAFGRKCPNYEARGWCNYGWKCLFVKSHSEEKTHPDGKQELILLGQQPPTPADEIDARFWNLVSNEAKINLSRRRTKAPKSDSYAIQEQHASAEPTKDPIPESDGQTESNGGKVSGDASTMPLPSRNSGAEGDAVDGDAANGAAVDTRDVREGKRAAYCESRFLPSEKRRLYFGPETPVLAPLTTQGKA